MLVWAQRKFTCDQISAKGVDKLSSPGFALVNVSRPEVAPVETPREVGAHVRVLAVLYTRAGQ
jgi:hypothetical protein